MVFTHQKNVESLAWTFFVCNSTRVSVVFFRGIPSKMPETFNSGLGIIGKFCPDIQMN